MHSRDREFPWNPAASVEVSPDEYERQVVTWLGQTRRGLASFKIRHQARLDGSSGEYTFDGVAEFEIFNGARIVVLVECKRHNSPVKRDAMLSLESKLRDVGAHKAMLFSTAGFQRGALEYAAKRGIATVTFIDGKLTYETKSAAGPPDPPPWANIPRFAAWFLTAESKSIHCSLLEAGRPDPVDSWLDR
ncbi:MAG: restriction endonuclease [Anaerolineales bacterium]